MNNGNLCLRLKIVELILFSIDDDIGAAIFLEEKE